VGSYRWNVAALIATGALLGCELTAPKDQALFDLVFEGYLGPTPELLVFDEATRGGTRRLPAGTVVMDPEPSPNGAMIAFVVANYGESTGDIYVMNRDGSNVVQLTFDPELDDQPAWSPDGKRIAFRSFRTQLDGDIWVMNADGTNQVNLFPDPLPGLIDVGRPAWSPSGQRIAFSSTEGGTRDIWTMRPDGTDRVQITSSEDLDTEPAWSPDGANLAFRRTYFANNQSDIFVVAARGGSPSARAITMTGEQRLPRWIPDGTQLVYVNQATVSARPDLYVMASDGSQSRALVTDAVAGGSINPAFLRRYTFLP
jgi:TolB protein